MTLTPLETDVLLYVCFVAGQWLFILKRAGSAIRNPNKLITTRRMFLYHNWDVLTVRAFLEIAFIFYPVRHFTFAQITGFFGWTPSNSLLNTVPDSPVSLFVLGYAADSLIDWLSVNPKLPAFVRNFIQENVPDLPNGNGGPH